MATVDIDHIPGWVETLAGVAFGAGGVKLLGVWLENRRLSKKGFRETLLERIRELEQTVSSLQVRVGNLRVELAHMEERVDREIQNSEALRFENDELRSRLEDCLETHQDSESP